MMIKFLISIIWISTVCSGQIKYDYFPKSALENDLSYFSEKLTSTHPLFLDKTYENAWKNRFEIAKAQLKDSMAQNEFYLLVSPLLASLNDGHSNFICPSDQRIRYMMSGGISFPFSVTIRDRSIFVTEYYGDDSCTFKGGEEILQINGLKASFILGELQKLIGGNSNAVRNPTIEMYFRTYLWMVFKFENDYKLDIKDNDNQLLKIAVKGITNEQFIKNRKRYPNITSERYSLNMNIDKRTANLVIHSFADLNSFCAFADSVFPLIAQSNIENLIIDIRGNGGGRSVVVDSLMNYLTDKPYSQYKKIETRISNNLKDYYKDKYPEKYENIKDYSINELITSSGEMVTPHDNKFRFKGLLFLLIDGKTYSGAATFAGLFKEMNLGIIIGEETGGTIEYFGDFWYSILPSSALQFYISPKRFVQFGGTDMKRGVLPDYLVPAKNDSIIRFTYDLIEEQQNTNSIRRQIR